jgi:hypothetical protein
MGARFRAASPRSSSQPYDSIVTTSAEPGTVAATKVELGCGSHKREGFFGIDIAPGPAVDMVLDIEHDALPFADDSIDHVYSSHTFEHLVAAGSPIMTLREIMRITRHGGRVEIWTPHGRSDDGLLFGHGVFYTETHWKHICYMYDDFYLGEGVRGRFKWLRTEYVCHPGILERLDRLRIPVDLALEHMENIALEFGVFLEVDKTRTHAEAPQTPLRDLCYRRGETVRRLGPAKDQLGPAPGLGSRLRRRVAASPAAPALRRMRTAGRRLLLKRH